MPLSCSCDIMAPAAPPLPSPRTARPSLSVPRRLRTPWVAILAVFVCFISHALAAPADAPWPVETLAIDQRSPYREDGGWVMLTEHGVQRRRIQKRATETEESESSESPEPSESSELSTKTSSGTVTKTFSIAVGTQTSSAASTSVAASPLPKFLDSLSNDFTAGANGAPAPCPAFINSFLADSEFQDCYPLSMLIAGNSKSFFEAQRSLVSITRTLDATCAANAPTCTKFLSDLAQKMIATENCGAEYQRGHTTVTDAYNAMRAYAPIYSAGCLRDPDTSAYCYANAVTNQTNPSTSYFYFLPLNKTLPGTTVPACGYCLQQTMALYQAATADRRQMIANTYATAAEQVNAICGPGFANETLAAEIASAAAPGASLATWLPVVVSFGAAFLWLG